MSADTAAVNIPFHGRRGKALDAEIARKVAEQNREQRANEKSSRAAHREAEANRPRLTRADIEGARIVSDGTTWYPVRRINAKSVTVPGVFGVGTRLIPISQIRQAKR